MAEQTRKRYTIEELAGSCPPAPVPDGVTPREESAAKWLHDSLRGYWGWADALDDARDLLAAVDGPTPDWADLREMARNAGWRIERTPKELPFRDTILWDSSNPDIKSGYRNVCISNDEGRINVDVWGPRGQVLLHEPAAGEVLAALRLVGLGGAS